MERYHIFKLGLAITFYAAYCIRPMMVNCQESENIIENNQKNKTQKPNPDNYWVYIQGVDGKPGIDFPVYSYIPRTTFSCKDVESGYYADMETDCQVFHICEEGKKISFLCPNGTIFHQSELICEWWNKVDCDNSPSMYEASAERLQNDIARRKASRRVSLTGGETKHGAVMRIEEESSVRASQNGREFTVRNNNNNGQNRNNKRIDNNPSKIVQNNNNFINEKTATNTNSNHKQNAITSKRNNDEDTGNYYNNIESTQNTQKLSVNSNYFTHQTTKKEYHVQFSTNSVTSTTPNTNTFSNSKVTQVSTSQNVNNQERVKINKNAVRSTISPPYRGSTKYYSSNNQNQNSIINNHQSTTRSPSLEILQAKEYPLGFPQHKTAEEQSQSNHKSTDKPIPEIPENDLDGESQVPQETASFVKNNYNSIGDSNERKFTSPQAYNNHRTTYSEVKQTVPYTTSKFSTSISSITPHLVTTQPFNNGKPFIGSRIGTTVVGSTSTTEKPTIIFGVVRHPTPETPLNPFGPYNVGSTSKTLPPQTTTSTVTNSLPTQLFNVGSTDRTINPQVVSTHSTTQKPLEIIVPQQGTLNLGQEFTKESVSSTIGTQQPFEIVVPPEGTLNLGEGVATAGVASSTTLRTPVAEPPFVKKFVAPLYSTAQPLVSSTETYVDHATVYGTFAKSSTTPRPNNHYFDNGIAVRFNGDAQKVGVQLTKSVGGGSTSNRGKPAIPARVYKDQHHQLRFGSTVQPPFLDVNANIHLSDIIQSVPSSTARPNNGFYVTKDFVPATGNFKSAGPKPRPFHKSFEVEPRLKQESSAVSKGSVPPYQISSARPFGLTDTSSTAYSPTVPTPYTSTTDSVQPQSETSSVYENVDNMLHVLMEIAKVKPDGDYSNEAPRPGLIIPPSVGPQTLHSLAQYFANENASQSLENIEPDMKEKLTTLLTQMTVHGYNSLFRGDNAYPSSDNQDNTAASTPTTLSTLSETTTPTSTVETRIGKSYDNSENDLKDEEYDVTTSTALRHLARNFSIALSSYLNDPDMFRKELEDLRPTEPPVLDNERSGTSEDQASNDDELLNFSDADIRTSLPPVYSTTPTSYLTPSASPQPTWGYILASKPLNPENTENLNQNSLNPDLNTADTQSFIPKFNTVQVNEAQRSPNSKKSSSTELPVDHWTSSPEATKLWQKAFNVDPSVVNDHFETSTAHILEEQNNSEENSADEFTIDVEDESLPRITEPESQINYELRSLPSLNLNSTQVHGILIDFMNSTKSNESNRLQRILRKLNTTEDEFLTRMQAIEENPLTKRLILLLISECGANVTKDLGLNNRNQDRSSLESLNLSSTSNVFESEPDSVNQPIKRNPAVSVHNSFLSLVDPNLKETDQDARALQLLNSLYTIASRFGRK